ncbi:MAG: trypsin-like peptidase domain-containing protein [Saprospiraceae bacterium]|nr:trypsin-like peptidase domain-containing protein [Saprospiraceae bacterium]
MKKYTPLLFVSLFSAFFAVSVYRYFEPERHIIWNDSDGEVRYAGLVDKLFDARNNSLFHSAAPTEFITAAEIATPAVVNIRALIEVGGGMWRGGTLSGSSGSGVIMSPDGYVVTNHHVVENSTDIRVTMADKREYKAVIVGADPSTDIALIKIEETDLPFLVFGNSDSVRIGEWVLAVGNPFNLESTVTAGIISAKGRNINILGGGSSIESFIQTDAAVNPGNSGGALVNTVGELIGINTAIITESGNYEGYSFAVPANLVQKVIRDLREFGVVQRAFLGINIEDLDSERARAVGLPNAEGVYVTRVQPGSAAEQAGLRSGDVITGLNYVQIRRTPELQEYVGRFSPGDQVTVEYVRAGQRFRSRVTLKNVETEYERVAQRKYRGDELDASLGLTLRNLSDDESDEHRLSGAVVSSVRRGSVVYETNVQPGFVITSVNGNRIQSMGEAIEAIKNAYSNISLDGYYMGEPDLYSYRFRK